MGLLPDVIVCITYLLKNYERKVYIILMFKNSKLLHLFIPPEKKLCVGVCLFFIFLYLHFSRRKQANMAGKYNGAQAIVRKIQPLAPYVHCAAHCVNLITQRSCTASIFIRNSLDWVNELGVLFGQSGKLKDIFKGIARSDTIRPLCPTRWTVRTSAIRTVLNQYECIIKALAEMAVSESDAASKAQGLYETFQQGNVILGLVCALEITGEL